MLTRLWGKIFTRHNDMNDSNLVIMLEMNKKYSCFFLFFAIRQK